MRNSSSPRLQKITNCPDHLSSYCIVFLKIWVKYSQLDLSKALSSIFLFVSQNIFFFNGFPYILIDIFLFSALISKEKIHYTMFLGDAIMSEVISINLWDVNIATLWTLWTLWTLQHCEHYCKKIKILQECDTA